MHGHHAFAQVRAGVRCVSVCRSRDGVPAAGLPACGLCGVAWGAQAAAVDRVVWVESLGDELPAVERIVISDGGLGLAADHAHGVLGEYACTEPVPVPAAVAALGAVASALVG